METLIVGGGPAGLYAGLLIKKARPRDAIHLVERNPAGATYGWGVVFSDRTLNTFREADPKTAERISDSFVLWQAIDTHYRGQRIRCGGHSFAGLSRQKLLLILQERCRELGVQLSFERELTDLSAFAGYDLVVAADGVNSLIRSAFAAAFRPSLAEGAARYVWYGTERLLDAFTFLFRENEHGLFQAHAYPFDGTTGTFIVECAEEVWRAAGLDEADEAASIAYCQALFADFLQGRPLLSNRSLWSRFVTVKNAAWRHANIILLGDAAHTAHFSIGSGTRLAMEGAISLAQSLSLAADLDEALNRYEMDRRPRVELLQAAAADSQRFFENIRRYLHLDPLPFTTNLLTRSGRVQFDQLRVRDPEYVERVERDFGPGEPAARLVAAPPLFAPLELAGLRLANRVALRLRPAGPAEDGLIGRADSERWARQAASGAALLLTEPVAVAAEGRISPDCPGLYCAGHEEAWRALVAAVHAAGPARIGLQLGHAGRRGA
ncbi:MAG: FAD-dependent monooxygenase, partial [Candidatus Promineifilaceae bacterium]